MLYRGGVLLFLRLILFWSQHTPTSCQCSLNDSVMLDHIPYQRKDPGKHVFVKHRSELATFVDHPCQLDLAVYASPASPNLVVASNDLFSNEAVELIVNKEAWSNEEPFLDSMVFTAGKLVVVISGKVFVYPSESFEQLPWTAEGIPTLVTSVTSAHCCIESSWCSRWQSVVIAYSTAQPTNAVFYSKDGGLSFVAISFSEQAVIIESVAISISIGGFMVLYKTTPTEAWIAYALILNSPHSLPVKRSFSLSETSSRWQLSVIRSGFGSVLIWSSESSQLFYLPQSDAEVIPLTIPTGSTTTHRLRDVISNEKGEIALLYDDGSVAFGREGSPFSFAELMLTQGLLTALHVIKFEQSANLVALLLERSSSYTAGQLHFSKESIPVHQLQEASTSACLVTDVNITAHYDTYLDFNDRANWRLSFSPAPWVHVYPKIEMFTTGFVFTELTQKQVTIRDLGAVSEEWSAEVFVQQDKFLELHAQVEAENCSHIINLRLTVEPSALSCPTVPQKVVHVVVGCPTAKNLQRSSRRTDCNDYKHGYTYTLQRDQYDLTYGTDPDGLLNGVEREVAYDFHKFGCPVRTYYNEPFEFGIDVYDGNTFLHPFASQHVVYEVNGAVGFEYQQTIGDVQCHGDRTPQTWKERLLAANSTDPGQVWNRTNFRGCGHQMSSSNGNSTQGSSAFSPDNHYPYEVLKAGAGNSLTFTRNGLYLFQVIAVDPEFSFCNLRLYVAVEVFGVQPQVEIPPFLVVGVVVSLSVVGLLIVHYLLQRQRNEAQALQDELTEVSKINTLLSKFEIDGGTEVGILSNVSS